MKIEMVMPQMGESIVEGTIVKWRKRPGEWVQKDEMILEISTDKVDSEIPAPASGLLVEILAEEGKTVAVNVPIARISMDEAESVGVVPTAIAGIAAPQQTAAAIAPAAMPDAGTSAVPPLPAANGNAGWTNSGVRRFLSPVVKKIAREQGLTVSEVERIQGRGENQRITKQDILDYLARRGGAPAPAAAAPAPLPISPAPRPAAGMPAAPVSKPAAAVGLPEGDQEIIPMDHVRKRIAEHMIVSKHTSAHVTSVAEVDVTPLVQYRERVKVAFEERESVPLTYTAFFIDAAARALKEFPFINASMDQERIFLKKSIHIGIAVGLEDKLIVPVIRHADRLNLSGIARAVSDLANRARSRQLKPDEVQGGTFSITNIGTFGNLWGTPIINQPQVAILGTGAIKKRPVVINEAIAIRSMMYLSLTYDHRLIDGLYAGRFLQRIVQILETAKYD
ncbi:MAG TPA: dihydrolipoamide acetyltransferase family protein [bacterium]|nr:dihydrolipoamide acetyltransferase family protein [bacterium]HQI48217.1 dihydrolipoamide acetyltransferase family protein [bacterium]HQJ64789.1 dihydrolipoamide acetyltransferase family protein [bacterium]